MFHKDSEGDSWTINCGGSPKPDVIILTSLVTSVVKFMDADYTGHVSFNLGAQSSSTTINPEVLTRIRRCINCVSFTPLRNY